MTQHRKITKTMPKESRPATKKTRKSTNQEAGLGTEIARLFKRIGLKPGEEIAELRGFTINSPFEE